MDVGTWYGFKFLITPAIILSFQSMTIKSGCDTEDKTSGDEKYVSRKNANAAEVSFTVPLLASAGCDVFGFAMAYLKSARTGDSDYFYLNGKKLVPYKLMLTSASIDNVEIGASGKWVRADVKLTFKQSSKSGADSSSGSGGGSGGSKKKSTKKKNVKPAKDTGPTFEIINEIAKRVSDSVTTAERASRVRQQKIERTTKNGGLGSKINVTARK